MENNIIYEEDILQACSDIEIGLEYKNGRMVVGNNVIYNARLFTKEYGLIWYGDLILDEDLSKLEFVAKKMVKTKLYILKDEEWDLQKAIRVVE